MTLVKRPLDVVVVLLSGLPRLPGAGSGSQQAVAEGPPGRAGPAGEAGGNFGATGQAAQPFGASVQRGCASQRHGRQ